MVAAAFNLNAPAPFANQTTVPHFLFIITILRLTKLILVYVICMYNIVTYCACTIYFIPFDFWQDYANRSPAHAI